MSAQHTPGPNLSLLSRQDLLDQRAELLRLLQEALRAGNANTRALKSAIEKASPGWCAAARAAIAKATGSAS